MYNPVQIRSFVAAVDAGSLSAAARKLNLTQPAVSQHLSQLERQTGLTLLVRSNHGVKPTQAGEIVLRHGGEILREMAQLSDQLAAFNGKVSGHVTFSTNLLFTQTLMVPVLAFLRATYPELTVTQKPTDDFVDLDSDGIDIALRSGWAGDGSGVVRRIAAIETVLVGCPAYLAQHDPIDGPDDLKKLNYVQYKEDPDQTHIDLVIDGVASPAPVSVAFAAQTPSLVMHAIENGLGIARLPRFMAQAHIETGDYAEVLPDVPMTSKPVFLLQTKHGTETMRNAVFRRALFTQIEAAQYLSLSHSARAELESAAQSYVKA